MYKILLYKLFIVLTVQLGSQDNLLSSNKAHQNQNQTQQTPAQTQANQLANGHIYQVILNNPQVIQGLQRYQDLEFINSCKYDTSILEHLSKYKKKGQGTFGTVIIAPINDQQQEVYAFKIMDFKQKHLISQQKEIQLSILGQQLKSQDNNLKIPTYYGCYLAYYQHQTLGYEMGIYGDEQNVLENDPRPYFNYSKQYRQQNMIQLFYTLKVLHDKQIVLRDIKPENIMTDENLENVTSTHKPSLSLYFIDFGLGLLKSDHSQTLAGTLAYVHPQQLLNFNKNPEFTGDVFALCLSYFVIEDYITLRTSESKEILDGLDYKLNVETDQTEYQQFSVVQRRNYLQNRMKAIRKFTFKRYNDQFRTFDFEVLNNDILECLTEAVQPNQKAQRLAEICQNEIDCIFYAGFQDVQEQTPSAEIIYQASLIAKSNKLMAL